MTDLHELLQRDGRRWQADFRPPDLDAMLAEATRRAPRARWAWPIVAAVLLLTIPLATVLLRSNPRHRLPAVAARPDLRVLGSVPWVTAVDQGNGRSVSVSVDVNRSSWCLDFGLPVLRASAVESPTRIVIRVQAYQPAGFHPPTAPPGSVLGCSAVGHAPVPVLVELHAPIGRRSLVDAATGQSHPVEQAAELPSLTKLPAGYVDGGSSPAQGAAAQRVYRNGSDLLILMRSVPGTLQVFAVTQVQATGTVAGHPAKVGGFPGSRAYRCAVWSSGGYTWQLCSTGVPSEDPQAPLSAAELLAVANSIR